MHNTHLEYNGTHDLILTRDNEGNTFQTSYNGPKGLRDTVTDAKNIQTVFTYDATYGNLQTSRTAYFPAITYAYDPVGRMTSLTDQAGSNTSFEYDKRDLLTSKTDPQNIKATFTYYDDGLLNTKTDRNGNTTTYDVIQNGQIKSITSTTGAQVLYTYNLLNQVTQIQDSTGTSSYSYDPAGRMSSSTNPFGFTIGYNYDAAGNLTQLTYPGDKKVIYGYDQLNRLAWVIIDWLPGKPVSIYNYDEAGRMTDFLNFNGTDTAYGYDTANRLTSINSPVASYSFTLDPNGNRTDITQDEPYDAVPPSISTALAYNTAKNRLTNAGSNTFGYDYEGQLKSGYGRTYTFDYEHRLTGTAGTSYYYDANGNRVQATRDGITTRYIYDASGNLLAEADGNNNITKYYIYGQGLIAMVAPDNQLYNYHYNATGSTVAVTDVNRQIVDKYAYDPFGNILKQEEAVPQPFKFVGGLGVMAEPNGFIYMRARYYDPNVGRFISEDPAGFDGGSVNLSIYVQNNPINNVDPTGLWSVTFGLYLGGGGEVTFGKDDGHWFVTGRVGIGVGGGLSYDPNGGIPGPAIKNPSTGGLVLSDSTQVGFNAGPLSAGIEGGVARNYSNGESSTYGSLSYGATSSLGISAGTSIGGQLTIYGGCHKP